MDEVEKQESPIIRLTRCSVKISLPEKRSKVLKKDGDTIVYGVDANGNERVYAQIPSDKWKEWSKTDLLWKQAQSAMFDHLLSNPRTRDYIIKTYLQATLEKGDEDTITQDKND